MQSSSEKWVCFLETRPCRDIFGDKPDNPVVRSGEKAALRSLALALTHTPVTHTGNFFNINWTMVRCCEKGEWTLCHWEIRKSIHVTCGMFACFCQPTSSCQTCLYFFKGKCKPGDTDVENTLVGMTSPSCLQWELAIFCWESCGLDKVKDY